MFILFCLMVWLAAIGWALSKVATFAKNNPDAATNVLSIVMKMFTGK